MDASLETKRCSGVGENGNHKSDPRTHSHLPLVLMLSPKMESPAFQAVSSFSSSLLLRDYSSIMKTRELKVSAQKKLEDEYPSLAVDKVLRSTILRFVGVNVVLGNVSTVVAAPMQEMKDPNVLRTLKLASGVIIQDIVEGQGNEAHEEDTVEFNYVCRRSNGYFVHSTVDQFSGESSPVIIRLGGEQVSIPNTFMVERNALGNAVAYKSCWFIVNMSHFANLPYSNSSITYRNCE
ncbi:hypothetical protein ACS0TY_033287 [Phlomoides rotata]